VEEKEGSARETPTTTKQLYNINLYYRAAWWWWQYSYFRQRGNLR
jgi:hypothetical protein